MDLLLVAAAATTDVRFAAVLYTACPAAPDMFTITSVAGVVAIVLLLANSAASILPVSMQFSEFHSLLQWLHGKVARNDMNR